MRLRYVLPLLTLMTAPGMATDWTQPVLDQDGKPACREALLRDDKTGKPLDCPREQIATLGWYARTALNATFPDETNLSGDDKAKRGGLAQSLVGATEVKLKVEDLALIKKLIGKAYGPLVVYQAWEMLEK